MKSIRILTALALGWALAAAAPAQQKPRDSATLYSLKCALCHGKDGAPSPVFVKKGVKSLKDPAWQAARSDAEIREKISKGVEDTLMRGFQDEMTDAEIDAMVAFVRAFRPASP